MQQIERLEFTLPEAIECIKSLKPEDVNIKLNKATTNGANYHSINFNIKGKPSTFTVKFTKENLKLKPQKQGQYGPSKPKLSLMLNDSELGSFIECLETLVIAAIRLKFKENVYPKINGFVQKTISKTNEQDGIEQITNLDRPLGWITLPHCIKPLNKEVYGGTLVFVNKDNTFAKLTRPSFETVQETWKNRALVTGSIKLEQMLVMKTKDIYIKVVIDSFKSLTIKPIENVEEVNEDDIKSMQELTIQESDFD